jgi:hypothetical protein
MSIEDCSGILCDEAYLTPDVSREIDKIVKDFREGKLLAKPIAAGEVELRVKQRTPQQAAGYSLK